MGLINNRKEATAWQKKYDDLSPNIGDSAPDFQLTDVSGNNSIRLSDFTGQKPVALIFGSFTWPPYAKGTGRLSDIYEKFKDQVEFISIYIREAHPIEGWWFGKGPMSLLLKIAGTGAVTNVNDPQTLEERREVAGRCEEALKYGIHTYVDDVDDAVNKAYAAWPTRLYLVDIDGKIVYKGGLGPFGFKPKEFGRSIEAFLNSQ